MYVVRRARVWGWIRGGNVSGGRWTRAAPPSPSTRKKHAKATPDRRHKSPSSKLCHLPSAPSSILFPAASLSSPTTTLDDRCSRRPLSSIARIFILLSPSQRYNELARLLTHYKYLTSRIFLRSSTLPLGPTFDSSSRLRKRWCCPAKVRPHVVVSLEQQPTRMQPLYILSQHAPIPGSLQSRPGSLSLSFLALISHHRLLPMPWDCELDCGTLILTSLLLSG